MAEEVRGAEFRKVVAIIRCIVLDEVEKKLEALGVAGFTTTRVSGCGEEKNLFFSRSPKVVHARLEVFAEKHRAQEIARVIMDAAYTGDAGDGLVAILPVERIWRVRSKREAVPEDLG